MLEWVDENTRNIVNQFSIKIRENMKNVIVETRGRYLCFFIGKPSTKSIFVGLVLTKGYLKVRIRTDPNTLKDLYTLLNEKVYSGWFFKQGQEREFKIQNISQISSALKLIKHSYKVTESILEKKC